MKFALLVGKLGLMVIVAVIDGASNDLFLMMGSAGMLAHLSTPSLSAQFLLFGAFVTTLFVPAERTARLILVAVGTTAMLVGSHRLVVDDWSSEVRDIVLGITVQTLAFNGDSEDVPLYTRNGWVLDVKLAKTHRGFWTLSPPVIGLDTSSLPRPATP